MEWCYWISGMKNLLPNDVHGIQRNSLNNNPTKPRARHAVVQGNIKVHLIQGNRGFESWNRTRGLFRHTWVQPARSRCRTCTQESLSCTGMQLQCLTNDVGGIICHSVFEIQISWHIFQHSIYILSLLKVFSAVCWMTRYIRMPASHVYS